MESIKIGQLNKVCLGIQGENLATTVKIDVSEWLKDFPNGTIIINAYRPTENIYYNPVISVVSGVLTWVVTNIDNAISGVGKAEIKLVDGNVVKKSTAFTTCIEKGLDLGEGPVPPTPTPSWVEELIEDVAEIKSAYLKDATVEDNILTITKQDDSTVVFEGSQNGYYAQLKKIDGEDYAYDASYIELNYDYAKKRLANDEPEINVGACSSVRNGNFFGRNLDWLYDNKVSFTVHTPHIGGRYATTAVCGQIGGLTKDFVESGAYSNDFVLLPFIALDGRNENGVFASVNIVPTDKGENAHAYPSGTVQEVLSANMLVRYIIDNFDTAQHAVEYIAEHCEIYTSRQFLEKGFNSHWLVGDKTSTYLIELIEGDIVVTDLEERPYITNFHDNEVTYNADGTVYTPSTQDSTHNAVDTNNIEIHGQGLERYNIIVNGYANANTKSGMRSLLAQLKYTNAYQPDQDWFTEFTGGDLHVNSEPSAFADIVAQAQQAYQDRSRDNPVTWQTVHSSVYDIKTGELYVIFQEGSVEHVIPFDTIESGKIDVIALGNTDLPIVDKKVTIPFAVPNGVASLGEDGLIPTSQLPSYVDDVVEYDTFDDFPEVGESGKIYVALDTNMQFRWSGTAYVEIGSRVHDVQVNNASIVEDGIANIIVDETPTNQSKNFVESGGVYSSIQAERQARIQADDEIDSNITTLAGGLSEAQQNIQELENDIDAEVTRATNAEGELLADIDDLQEQIDAITVPVTSVNNKTGDVVLNATDIKLTTNQQTVEANFIRIDEEINRVDEAKLDKVTPTDEGTFLYSTTMEGQGTVEAKNTPTASAIPQYDEYGNIKSSTPVESNDVITKEYGDGRYAPITYVSNLYGSIYLGGQTVRLIDNKPTAGQYNFLTSISTNTEYNWNSPTITFDRVIESPIDLSNTNSLTFTLKYKTDRTATISWGAKVQCSTDGQTWEDISTQQSFNAVTVQQGAGTSTDIIVFTDGVVGVRRLETGNYLRVLLFKKQESATSLSTDIYFGVMVDNAYVCTYAQFNFLSVTIDTTQIKDGSVTYQKLSENVQQTIDGKLDKVTIADGNVRTYTIEANGTQNYRRATSAATNNAMVLRDGNGRAKFNAPVDNLDAANKSYVDTGLGGKQNTIDNANKLSSDLVDDTDKTNKFVTSAEKQKIAIIDTDGDGDKYLADDGTYKQVSTTVDQEYDAESTNAQSGTAVAEAIEDVPSVTAKVVGTELQITTGGHVKGLTVPDTTTAGKVLKSTTTAGVGVWGDAILYSTTDLTPDVSELPTGVLYVVYEE